MDVLGYPLTYPTTCRECAEQIFFHTNGHGDVVLFDRPLGPPWPRHRCYEERVHNTTRAIYDRLLTKLEQLVGRIDVSKFQHSSPPVARPMVPRVSQNKRLERAEDHERLDIVRCDPEKFKKKRIYATGWVHDLHERWHISRFAPSGTLGFVQYQNAIRATDICQITLIDSDNVSYTAIVPTATARVRRGDIVSVELERVELVHAPAFYVCRALGRVELSSV